jgi:hypothetical protein
MADKILIPKDTPDWQKILSDTENAKNTAVTAKQDAIDARDEAEQSANDLGALGGIDGTVQTTSDLPSSTGSEEYFYVIEETSYYKDTGNGSVQGGWEKSGPNLAGVRVVNAFTKQQRFDSGFDVRGSIVDRGSNLYDSSRKLFERTALGESNTVVVTGDATDKNTRETAVRNAVNKANNENKDLVFVPHEFGPGRDTGYVMSNSLQNDLSSWGGRLVKEGQSFIGHDIKAYGAAGNQNENDAQNIIAAIDQAGQGGVVVFPEGEYIFEQQINMNYNSQTWIGSGADEFRSTSGSNLLNFTGSSSAISIKDVSGFSLHRLHVKEFGGPNQSTNASSNLVSILGMSNSYIENLMVDANDNSARAIKLATSNSGTYYNTFVNLTCKRATTHGLETSGDRSNSNSINANTFISPKFTGNASRGIILGDYSNNNVLVNPAIEGNGNDGLMNQARGNSLFGGYIEGNGGYGIRLSNVSGQNGSSGFSARNVLIQTNSNGAYRNNAGTPVNLTVSDSNKVYTIVQAQKKGFFGSGFVKQQSALTSKDDTSFTGSYGSTEENVIKNNRTRIDEIEDRLTAYGLLP